MSNIIGHVTELLCDYELLLFQIKVLTLYFFFFGRVPLDYCFISGLTVLF